MFINNQKINTKNSNLSEKYSNKKRNRFLYISVIALIVFLIIFLMLHFFYKKDPIEIELKNNTAILTENNIPPKSNHFQLDNNLLVSSNDVFELKDLLENYNIFSHFNLQKLSLEELKIFLTENIDQLNDEKSFFLKKENRNYFLNFDKTNLYLCFFKEKDEKRLQELNISILKTPELQNKITEPLAQFFQEIHDSNFISNNSNMFQEPNETFFLHSNEINTKTEEKNTPQKDEIIYLDNSGISTKPRNYRKPIMLDNNSNKVDDNSFNPKQNNMNNNNNSGIFYGEAEISKTPSSNNLSNIHIPNINSNFKTETLNNNINKPNEKIDRINTDIDSQLTNGGIITEDLAELPQLNREELVGKAEELIENNIEKYIKQPIENKETTTNKDSGKFYQDDSGVWRNIP